MPLRDFAPGIYARFGILAHVTLQAIQKRIGIVQRDFLDRGRTRQSFDDVAAQQLRPIGLKQLMRCKDVAPGDFSTIGDHNAHDRLTFQSRSGAGEFSLQFIGEAVHVAADLTEAQCRAYRIADNRAGEEARWDDELLKLEISELGVLAELTAFDPKEMRRLGLAEDAAQDPIPAPPASPMARLGQIWQLGQASAPLRRFYAPGIRFTLDGR